MINLQQSPKNQDVGRGLRKIVACSLNPPRSAFLLTRGAHAPEGYGSWVCVSVCLFCVSVTYRLTFPLFICLRNNTTYPTGNEGQSGFI